MKKIIASPFRTITLLTTLALLGAGHSVRADSADPDNDADPGDPYEDQEEGGSGSGSSGPVAAPSAPNMLQMQQTIGNSVFSKSKPANQSAQAAATSTPWNPLLDGDIFYDHSELKGGGGGVDTYGVNLSATTGDKLQFRLTVPLYHTEVPGLSFTTYGVDGNVKYRVMDDNGAGALSAGGHLNYLTTDISGAGYNWALGPYLSYVKGLTTNLTLSAGILADRISPQHSQTAWVGGFGVNLGIALGDKFAINPFYVYYNNFDAASSVNKDWHDLGVEFAAAVTKNWNLNVGAKTSLGFDAFDYSIQVYLGSSWKF